MKTWMFTLLLIISTTLSATIKLQGPEKIGKSDSGIRGSSYQKIVEEMQQLSIDNPHMVEVADLGSSAGGIETYGALLRNSDVPTKKLFLVTGATHGNEYLNIADRLMHAFLDKTNLEFKEFFDRGGAFFVVPVFNPDGYTARERYNANGADLNRDYTNLITDIVRFNENETRNMQNWLDGFLDRTDAKVGVTMDYHCCYKGSLLFPWGFTKDKIPSSDRTRFDEIGNMMQKYFSGRPRYGAVSEIIWYLADGTSHDYYYAKYGSLSMTYEGRYKTEKNMLPEHILWWKNIVSRFGN